MIFSDTQLLAVYSYNNFPHLSSFIHDDTPIVIFIFWNRSDQNMFPPSSSSHWYCYADYQNACVSSLFQTLVAPDLQNGLFFFFFEKYTSVLSQPLYLAPHFTSANKNKYICFHLAGSTVHYRQQYLSRLTVSSKTAAFPAALHISDVCLLYTVPANALISSSRLLLFLAWCLIFMDCHSITLAVHLLSVLCMVLLKIHFLPFFFLSVLIFLFKFLINEAIRFSIVCEDCHTDCLPFTSGRVCNSQ